MGGSARADLSAIARGGALNLAGSVVAGVSAFVLTIVVTNFWDIQTAGILFSGTSVLLILGAVALLGTDTGLARFVLRYEALSRASEIDVLLRMATRAVVLTGFLFGGVVVLAAAPISHWLGIPDEGVVVLRILGIALPLMVLTEISLAATRAYGVMRTTVVVDRLVRCGVQLVSVAVAAAVGVGLAGLTVAWALPYVLAAIMAPVALARLRRTRSGRARPRAASSAEATAVQRDFWSFTWPRAIARICQVCLQRADILMVAALRSPAEAAFYTVATRFVVLGQLGVQAVQQVLQPRLSQLLALDENAPVQQVFKTTTAWIMALAWPIYLTTVIVAPLYLSMFGSAYADVGEFTVVVIGLGMLLAVAAGPVDVLLLMSGKSATSLLNNLASLAVNISLNLVLIPRMGFNGAAVSWAVALVVRNALPFWQIRRSMGLTGFGRAAALVAATGVGCFVVPMAVLRVAAGLTVVGVLPLLVVESLVYAALLWRARSLLQLPGFRRRGTSQPAGANGRDGDQRSASG